VPRRDTSKFRNYCDILVMVLTNLNINGARCSLVIFVLPGSWAHTNFCWRQLHRRVMWSCLQWKLFNYMWKWYESYANSTVLQHSLLSKPYYY
jgi:hypothetical protein